MDTSLTPRHVGFRTFERLCTECTSSGQRQVINMLAKARLHFGYKAKVTLRERLDTKAKKKNSLGLCAEA